MTKKEYMNFHETKCREMIEITKRKNADYAGSGDDPFSNFRQIGSLIQKDGVVEIGFLTRMSDKFSRIGSFVSKGTLQVKEESVEDTLLDLANYCILFAGYLRSQKPSPKDGTVSWVPAGAGGGGGSDQAKGYGAGPSAKFWNKEGRLVDGYKSNMEPENRMDKPRSDLPSQNGMNIP